MTFLTWFGCTCIAFGPSLAIFAMTIANDATHVIIMFTSAFFWLISLFISSLAWLIPFNNMKLRLGLSVAICVIIQEVFRYFFFSLMKKADQGLLLLTSSDSDSARQSRQRRHKIAYVSGFGYGVMSGAFSIVNLLAVASGPGTVGIKGNSEFFFVSSAILTSLFILLNIFWSVILFDGCHKRDWKKILYVVITHELAALMTLLNIGNSPNYLASILTIFVVMSVTMFLALYTAGGNIKTLISCFSKRSIPVTTN